MTAILTYLIVLISAFFVFYDTTKNKIGKIPGDKGFLNLSPGLWATATCLLWIIAFPLYLINRSKLIEKAKNDPQEISVQKKKIGFSVIGILVAAFFLLFLLSIVSVKSNIEAAAIPVVTQIVQGQFGAGNLTECVAVKLGNEFAPNHFYAVATLNNGNTLNVTIQRRDDDKIYVQIPYNQ